MSQNVNKTAYRDCCLVAVVVVVVVGHLNALITCTWSDQMD